jgi:hypothetical protein
MKREQRKKLVGNRYHPDLKKDDLRKKWENILQDLKNMKIQSLKACVRRKEQWKKIVELAKTHSGL